ncbi:MAG: SPOR domain-containing protein, partial [Paramuribaculum sp.]|nr:SPOR domain-containing protein [Paramuribaculum sp.]
MKRYCFLLIAVVAGLFVSAQTAGETDIVAHITENGINTVVQPEALAKLLKKSYASSVSADTQSSEAEEVTVSRDRNAGYRVQVFSDNRPAAKGEARAKGNNIAERFPNYRTYVKYTSPYWRLRVGDFRTRREA